MAPKKIKFPLHFHSLLLLEGKKVTSLALASRNLEFETNPPPADRHTSETLDKIVHFSNKMLKILTGAVLNNPHIIYQNKVKKMKLLKISFIRWCGSSQNFIPIEFLRVVLITYEKSRIKYCEKLFYAFDQTNDDQSKREESRT